MPTEEDLKREIRTLRERLSLMSQASLSINESLDVEKVLQRVLDSARVLTDARYGVITLLEEGVTGDFLASGLTPEQARQLWEVPGGRWVYEALSRVGEPFRVPDFLSHVRALSRVGGPFRVPDFLGHLQSLSLPEFGPPLAAGAEMSLLAAPVRHRGESVGYIFVSAKQGQREFTQEDEDTLVMFASQAALVIANARRYRDEQRARADLETLIDTSPVGVVVFDARTGVPASMNREAVRIMQGLLAPEQRPEQLLEVLTVRRADGQEISLETLSVAQALSAGETVRAEEVVLQIPGGRQLTVLINATPITGQEGVVESYVTTLQDMTPLGELERLRAEFLAMVSHELRIPMAAIKGAAVTVLGDSSEMVAAEMIPFFRIINQQADHMTGLIRDLLDVAHIQTGTLLVDPGPTTLADLVDEARSAFLSGGDRHPLQIDLAPDLPPVMADRRRVVQVLGNLLGNAARHSPESAAIRVTAERQGVHLEVSVIDQGRGVSPERLPHLFRKFPRLEGRDSTSEAGSGLGLAICKGILEAHGGRIWAESDGVGRGARFTFTLPMAEEAEQAPPPDPTRPAKRRRGQEGARILVVDDDPQTLRNLREDLRRAGYAPIVTGDPDEVAALMEKHDPQLVLLDLVLPGVDGIELMRGLGDSSEVPVIFLSAYGQDEVIARAFDAGAADYMVKPFSPTELVARVRAALRNRLAAGPAEPMEAFVLGNLTLDYAGRRLTLAGRPVRLTNIEYRLLAELSVHAGRVLPYEHLLERVWGPGHTADLRPLRAAVKNLRRKLGDRASRPTYIFNEARVGYRLANKPTATGRMAPPQGP